METSLSVRFSSLCHHPPCFPAGLLHWATGLHLPKRARTMGVALKRDGDGGDFGGDLVDEDMIVLRKRIHEMKMAEKNYEPPSHWMVWEKQYYTSYDADVCEVVGLLQTVLMNTRPSLAIGMMTLILLSVPTSVFMILFHLMEAWRSVVPGFHPS